MLDLASFNAQIKWNNIDQPIRLLCRNTGVLMIYSQEAITPVMVPVGQGIKNLIIKGGPQHLHLGMTSALTRARIMQEIVHRFHQTREIKIHRLLWPKLRHLLLSSQNLIGRGLKTSPRNPNVKYKIITKGELYQKTPTGVPEITYITKSYYACDIQDQTTSVFVFSLFSLFPRPSHIKWFPKSWHSTSLILV